MTGYLVRLTKNRDLVGVFVADDLDELIDSVDECTDVSACEYIEMPPGGIMWTSPAVPVPLSRGEPDDEKSPLQEVPWSAAQLSETWFDVLYGYTEGEWIPFDPDAPSEPPPLPRPMGPGQVIRMRKRGD